MLPGFHGVGARRVVFFGLGLRFCCSYVLNPKPCSDGRSDAVALPTPASNLVHTAACLSKHITRSARAEGRGRRFEASPVRGARRPGEHLPHCAHPEQVGDCRLLSLGGERAAGARLSRTGTRATQHVSSEMFAGQRCDLACLASSCLFSREMHTHR